MVTLGMVFDIVVWAQDGYRHYQYQPSTITGSGSYSGYQWRPLDEQLADQGEKAHTFRGGSEILPSQSYPIYGLPPGTYRPLDGVNRISPQLGKYRFRAISPAEQSRNEKQERLRNQQIPDSTQTQFRFRGHDSTPTFWHPESTYQPLFRPDERFSNRQSGQTYQTDPYSPYQSYNPPSLSPNFRRQD